LRPDLYEAAKCNDATAVATFLDDDVPPDFKDGVTGWTALHWAAMHGNVPMVKGLLAAGASFSYIRAANIRASQRAAAAAAALGQNTRPVRRSSDASAVPPLDIENPMGDEYPVGEEKGLSPRSAAGNNNTNNSVTGNILPEGEQLEQEELDVLMPYLKNTPLLWASFKGHLRVVWLLLIDGYSPNDTDDMGNNALHLAAVNQHTKVLKILIDDGGSANAVNFYKNRPIDMATKREIRDMLVEAMHEGASYTDADVARRHEMNMKAVSLAS
jgi:ankyrin repeat protein